MNTRSTPTITVLLDGQPNPLLASTCLAELLVQLGHDPHAVSTAVNGLFVARGKRAAHTLQDGDAVLIFQPVVGG